MPPRNICNRLARLVIPSDNRCTLLRRTMHLLAPLKFRPIIKH
jgi:hypothetical protein